MAESGQTSSRFVSLLLLMIPMLLLSSSSSSQVEAREFHVGGKDGWVEKPSEDYSHWAQRNRFQVNDTLHFKYQKGADSVLVVKKEDYDSCNTNNPMEKMDNGDSTFHLDKSGLFFFISGNADSCKNGQKLIVHVMAIRHKLPPLAPAVAPSSTGIVPSSLTSPTPSPSEESGSPRAGGSVFVGVGLAVGLEVISILSGVAGLV